MKWRAESLGDSVRESNFFLEVMNLSVNFLLKTQQILSELKSPSSKGCSWVKTTSFKNDFLRRRKYLSETMQTDMVPMWSA